MYDVANHETFEALPKWFSEIDTYVSTTVPKIVVGNKVDKVLAFLLNIYSCYSLDLDPFHRPARTTFALLSPTSHLPVFCHLHSPSR